MPPDGRRADRQRSAPAGEGAAPATIDATGGDSVSVWFTVRLDDRPGALARLASALGDRAVNITGIVGVAEDTDGALMLTTSDPAASREAFAELEIAFEEHEGEADEPDSMSVNDVRAAGVARAQRAG
jgi:hypothetical protein